MKLSLERLSARMRQGETIPLRDTAGVVLMLSIPSILEQNDSVKRGVRAYTYHYAYRVQTENKQKDV